MEWVFIRNCFLMRPLCDTDSTAGSITVWCDAFLYFFVIFFCSLPSEEDLMLGKVCDIVSSVAVKTFSAKAEQIKGKASGRNVFTPQVLTEVDY